MATTAGGSGDVSELRPYVMTGGRVAADGIAFDLLLAATPGAACTAPRTREAQEVLRVLGHAYLTVAEVAATMRVPLGTAQVIVADLAATGAVRLFGTTPAGKNGSHVDERHHTLALLGSVIDGIGEL